MSKPTLWPNSLINRILQILIILSSRNNRLKSPEINPIFSQKVIRRDIKHRFIKEIGHINSINKQNVPKHCIESPSGFKHVPVVEWVYIAINKVFQFGWGLYWVFLGLVYPVVAFQVEVFHKVVADYYTQQVAAEDV